MNCLLCQGPLREKPVFSINDRLGCDPHTRNVYECSRCRSISLNPIPGNEEIERFYPPHYNFKLTSDEKGLKGFLKNLEWNLFYRAIYLRNYRYISSAIGKKTFSMLDVGCGSGLRLSVFKELGCQVEGNDTSETCVEYITRNIKVPAHKGTLEEIDWGDKRYDAITMFALLEHLPDPAATVLKARGLLSDEGVVVVQTPVVDSLQYRLFSKRAAMISDMPRHLFIPSVQGVTAFMEAQGLALVASYPVSALECASLCALSLLPAAATPRAYPAAGLSALLTRMAGWGLVLFPGIAVGLVEQITGAGAENIFLFRKRT
jgi:SAM-dependent methyltransferase